MGKAIRCTITGFELGKTLGTFYYVARMHQNEIALLGVDIKDIGSIKDNHDSPYAVLFDSVKDATAILKIVKATLKVNDPELNVRWSIDRIDAKHQRTNNRVSLKHKTRSVG